jgi:transcription elongation factor GreA
MTQSDERETIWLTQEAFDKKTAELAELRGPLRSEIVSRICAARDEGDLKENGGYHAAREELAKLEGRIQQIEQMLEKAEVGQADDDGTISPGFRVSYHFVGKADEVETFLLGAREMADGDIQVFSPQSPLGSALIGARGGATVTYRPPNGKKLKVVVVEAGPYRA